MKNAMSGSNLLIVGQVIFMISRYLMHITITRLLGPGDYGTWGILISRLI